MKASITDRDRVIAHFATGKLSEVSADLETAKVIIRKRTPVAVEKTAPVVKKTRAKRTPKVTAPTSSAPAA